MRQLNTLAVAIIAVLGATFTMVTSEMENRGQETTVVLELGHEAKEDSIMFPSTSSNAIRCYEKLGIEVDVNEREEKNMVEMKAADPHSTKMLREPETFSICEWENSNTRIVPSGKFKETGKQFVGTPESLYAQNILPETGVKPVVRRNSTNQVRDDRSLGEVLDESYLSIEPNTSTIDRQVIEKPIQISQQNITLSDSLPVTNVNIEKHENYKNDPLNLSSQNELADNDKTKEENPLNLDHISSTSKSLTYAKSERLILSTHTSEASMMRKLSDAADYESTEGSLEIPLIVSTPPWPIAWLANKEKSQEEISVDGKLPYSRKDHSKPSINLVDGGKPSKVFYEIKPSLNTAMKVDNDEDVETNVLIIPVTRRNFMTSFKLPSMPSSFGKFGPYFLDDVDRRNVTERIGNTVLLDCRIGLLGDKKVTWLQHDKDSIRLLTVGNVQYSADERISLKFQYPDNWRLQITYATLRDSGLYKCQVEIDPAHSLVKRYNVIITAPMLNITDDSGRPISGERHLKAGSTLQLKCEGRDILERLNESLLWTRGDETLTSDVSENRTTEIVGDKEMPVIVSTLIVERATPRHAGNYSCIVPERAKTTIAVHVLNGELPAAVHHGNGVSRAMLNLWLIHLTVSYGFFR